ncbi:MAG: hypothetical protein QF599_02175 [Planctomycetota bacterium]|nr:hypothetical protein [Planctomycetota bacterium]MDP6369486.1 hypothetical protein [Planctomycetota bacterium]MDP6520849.1 hypothetical protein [Planctomycetota bacterium]MDP6954756.1 hypothetical protein [Planctomycetota bacterium]
MESDRSPLEFSLTHRLLDNLQLGLEYDAEEDSFFPLVNWRVLDAAGKQPALALGISSAWPSSQVDGSALFVTAAQNIAPGLSLSASLSYGLEDQRFRTPGSLRYALTSNLSTTLFYDGNNLHPLASYSHGDLSYSLILLGASDPALSVSWGF